ncbi:hypothetical protein SAMN04488135_11413 [Pollutimonas bauzanensis]|uniref:Uncharacterized protein n=1 Tax=Pollutimonas bauzanensis TaxID=658167 RepID=A0A1M5ZE06_9BURK|nr:hypothetical protein SAMN04488135_11413 [Pollutimonas bauzanensis]
MWIVDGQDPKSVGDVASFRCSLNHRPTIWQCIDIDFLSRPYAKVPKQILL